MTAHHRRALLVLGMHRSGTSAVTAGLRVLGVDIGRDEELLPPTADNPKGYFEWAEAVYWHDVLLGALGRRWDDWAPLPAGWMDQPAASMVGETLTALVQRYFGEETLWGVKDPRLCLMVPWWRRILSSVGVSPAYLLVVRHPVSVARSLERRDGVARGAAWQLWMRYVMDSLQATHGARRVIVDYDAWIADPARHLERVARLLELPWPPPAAHLDTYCRDFVDPYLRHDVQLAAESDPAVPPYIYAAYAALRAVSEESSEERCLADRLAPILKQWEADAGWAYAAQQQMGRQPATIPVGRLEAVGAGSDAVTFVVPHRPQAGVWGAKLDYPVMFPVRQLRLILPAGPGVVHHLQLTRERSDPTRLPMLQVAGLVRLTGDRWGKLADPAWLQWGWEGPGGGAIRGEYFWEPAPASAIVYAIHQGIAGRDGP